MQKTTALDSAIEAARHDTAKADDFYLLFLDAPLYVPTRDRTEQYDLFSQLNKSSENTQFTPALVVEEGIHLLPVFDRLDRLKEWAGQELIYVQMPGHAIVEAIDPSIHLVLNPATPYAKEFVAAEVQWLKRVVAASRD